MLKSIDPILGADVLYALRAMGHGDELVIATGLVPRRIPKCCPANIWSSV